MSNIPFGILPQVEEPWGFSGVKREQRGSYGDSRAFYVQRDHVEATDSNSGEDPAHPLRTITRAIALARAYMGDTIYVMGNDSWQYGAGTQIGVVETVIVPVDKPGLTIKGVGCGAMGVYWSGAVAGDTVLTINAMDTVIEGFTFWSSVGGMARGVFCDWTAPATRGENTIIRNCIFTDDITIGIQLEFAWFVEIDNCHFQQCATHGIYVDPAGSGIGYCKIHDSWFNDCAIAMALDDADRCLIMKNMIYNTNAQNGAVATNEGINTAAGTNNIVANNFFSCLLPVPANGDWDDFNSGDATDAWIGNTCLNGVAVSTPT